MDFSKLKSNILRDVSNLPGWSTQRKIVVFESDDWGSVRMSSRNAFESLKECGIDESTSHYNRYDALESNADLEMLFDVLTGFKDKNGKHPVFTGVNIVANPDFEKIKAVNFSEYFYEPFSTTLNRYPNHDKVLSLWKQAIDNRLFVPIFHGREHLNVCRWMNALQTGHKSTIKAFEHGVTGITKGIRGEKVPNYQAAFDIDTPTDLIELNNVIETGLALFEKIYGYKSEYFVPTNGPFNNTLENVLSENNVRFINSAKIQHEPHGNGVYKKNIRFIGDKNKYGQVYLTRNCFFEPSSMEYPASTDWINNCMHEIESAFRWGKPATISSHRVNYIGFLHPENRERGLSQLSTLLSKMIRKWPEIEFMTSVELGHTILNSRR